MTRVLPWLLAAVLLFSTMPAAAQSNPDTDAPAGDESTEVVPEMDATPAEDATPVERPAAPPAARTDFPYGVLVADLSNAPRAHEAGFRVMTVTVSWRRTQPTRGEYPFEQKDQYGRTAANDLTNIVEAARNNGLKLGTRLIDPPDWAGGSPAHVNPADLEDYAYHAVRYAHDGLAYFELFNEQNLASEWGGPPDPAAFAGLMAAAYRGVKRADPSIPVINGGPAQRTGGLGGAIEDVDWLDRFLAAGGASSIDALGVHAYMGSFDANADPSCQPLCFGQVNEFRAVMQQHGAPQSIYITEFGALEETAIDLGQFNWQKLSPDVRASHLVGALRTASVEYPWIAGATLFNLDYATVNYIPPTSEQYWFSLLNPDKSPRQAFSAIRDARQRGVLP
jgi:Cellulase (glycosyl hydrolase family 5)